ncbi:unnamed protein product [Mucor hiemalis]
MFKRVRKELQKQKIEEDIIDADDNEERLAGVFSDSDSDSDTDNSDNEQTKRQKKRARRDLIMAVNHLADLKGFDEDEDSEEDSEEDNFEANSEEEEVEEGEDEDEELVDTYSCDVCPDKKLKNVEQVNIHLKSKDHIKRLRFLEKTGGLPKSEEEEDLPEDVKAKIAAKKEKAEELKLNKEKTLQEKKEAKVLKAKEKAKAHRKLVKQRKWERDQAAKKAIEEKPKEEPAAKKTTVKKAPVKKAPVKKAPVKKTVRK